MTSSYVVPSMTDGPHFEILERNWRRVASTHTLQDLLNADKPAKDQPSSKWKYFLIGCALIFSGLFIISLGTFSILILPWIDTTEYNDNAVSVAMKGDSYYHLLVPLTIPVTIIVVTLNWFSMKLFKHNS